jgi:hypothetical protein
LSPTIHIQVPSPTTSTNVLWEQLPFGVTPVDISDGGHWDVASRTLQWQDVGGQTTVSYSLMGTGNVCSISGWIASGGRFDATAGDGVAIVFAPEDADSDGLPDWWEQKFFDSRASALPEMDSDGDGQTNLAEFLAGTHPLSNGFQAQQWAPYLRLSMDDRFANLRVFGFEGASYRIENSTDLQNWFSISTNVLSGQSVVMPRMNLPEVNSLFYRAAVEER